MKTSALRHVKTSALRHVKTSALLRHVKTSAQLRHVVLVVVLDERRVDFEKAPVLGSLDLQQQLAVLNLAHS